MKQKINEVLRLFTRYQFLFRHKILQMFAMIYRKCRYLQQRITMIWKFDVPSS